jgi:hypothetical protein
LSHIELHHRLGRINHLTYAKSACRVADWMARNGGSTAVLRLVARVAARHALRRGLRRPLSLLSSRKPGPFFGCPALWQMVSGFCRTYLALRIAPNLQ